MITIFKKSGPSWHEKLRTIIIPVPEAQITPTVEEVKKEEEVVKDEIKPVIEERKVEWGDGTSFNIVYRTIDPKGNEAEEDYLLEFEKPKNISEAYNIANSKIHNLHPKNKYFEILEISKIGRSEAEVVKQEQQQQ